MTDITKLAEVIGLEKVNMNVGTSEDYGIALPDMQYDFNPFTDANDDYKVLEWARERRGIPRDVGTRYRDFMFELGVLQAKRDEASSCLHEAYEIGDYARAALKVLT